MEEFDYEAPTKIEKRRKDKADISTVDKVLDSKTLKIINNLIARKKLIEINGSFACGKEANIYTGKGSTALVSKFIQTEPVNKEEIVPVVLKIYKTSTMLFKDRTRYIVDEKRFKRFCKSNSRKLIKVWSEKEVRNLKRLIKHGILCPKPLYLKKSILIMTMVGDEFPAQKLKDLDLEMEEWDCIYHKCLKIIKEMYQKARLVHGDFSEYNTLYHEKEVYVIDVSQSMDVSQENSNSFLAMDICNCNDFFAKKGLKTLNEIELFEDITGLKIPNYLKVGDRLNKDSFIPTRIIEVANKEDLSLFIENYSEAGMTVKMIDSENKFEDHSSNYNSDDDIELSLQDELGSEVRKDNSSESNDTDLEASSSGCSNIHISESDELQMNIETLPLGTEAKFALKSFADLNLNSINIYVRRLRLKNPEITKEEEREANKQRKLIIKEMNQERRKARVIKKREYEKKNANKKKAKNRR